MNDALINLDPSIRHGYAQIGGVRLHYAERGSGGRLVLLLHGFPEFWYSWRHQLTALGENFHVVAPDMRGYNLSDKPARVEDYKVDLLVDDVLGLVRHFGEREAAIVGHDWGAGVAWAVAQRYPEYVWKLVAMQVPPMAAWRDNMTLRQALSSWYMLFFQLPRLPEWLMSAKDYAFVERIFKKAVARKGAFTDTDIAIYKKALSEPGALTAAINYYRANVFSMFMKRRRRVDEELSDGRIRVPTLFIYGEKDHAVMPETVRNLKAYIDAPYREVRIGTSAHWVQNEAVSEVNAALQSFLAAP
ncbi:MAG TPA: alpha/beta hydrolase [Pyrinomonadaceae bacterium]|jgi:pimeloyl-ACP methyl ester carboxylesterase|nr:alpha/beta hydrolase [Pyrinomonadaceae bacterium]